MKKTLVLLLALAMSCSMLAACSGKDNSSSAQNNDTSLTATDDSSVSDSSDPGSDTSADDVSSEDDGSSYISITLENETPKETDERLYEALMSKIADTGVYTINASVNDGSVAFDMYITTDGENTYMDFLGTAILSNADGDYMIDTEGKRYYLDETGGSAEANTLSDQMLGIFTATEGMTYNSTSTATIGEAEYTVEKYVNDESGAEFIYVFDASGALAFVGDGETFMQFEFFDSADDSKFSLDGFTEMTQEEYLEWFLAAIGQ